MSGVGNEHCATRAFHELQALEHVLRREATAAEAWKKLAREVDLSERRADAPAVLGGHATLTQHFPRNPWEERERLAGMLGRVSGDDGKRRRNRDTGGGEATNELELGARARLSLLLVQPREKHASTRRHDAEVRVDGAELEGLDALDDDTIGPAQGSGVVEAEWGEKRHGGGRWPDRRPAARPRAGLLAPHSAGS